MASKSPEDFDTDEVCLWLMCLGLGSKTEAFRENAVDGNMLVTLTSDELREDLGLTNLQSKKVLQKLEFSKELAAEDGGGDNKHLQELEEENEKLEKENADLKAELEKLKPKKEEEEKPKEAPAPAPAPKKKNEHEVARGAAGGAARGAVLGAVAGAVAGDAGKGAKIGAATGATAGGMRGVAAKRRNRFR